MTYPTKTGSAVALSLTTVLALGLFIAPVPSSAASTTRTLTAAEKAAVKVAVNKHLKDPTSPLFKWPKLQLAGGPSDDPQGKDNVYMYCGLVDAKNSYGGYVGFVPYYAMLMPNYFEPQNKSKVIARVTVIGTADPSSTDTQTALMMCRRYGYFE